MAGRLTKWTEQDFQAILTDLADGVPLSKALGGKRPGRTSLFKKIAEDGDFARAYDRAQTSRAQVRIEKIEDVVEKTLNGLYEPSAAKVALDLLWRLAKAEDPKRYSEVQRQEVSGAGGKDLFPQHEEMN